MLPSSLRDDDACFELPVLDMVNRVARSTALLGAPVGCSTLPLGGSFPFTLTAGGLYTVLGGMVEIGVESVAIDW